MAGQMITDTWHCPGCGAQLESVGTMTLGDCECSVFQCDTCVVSKPICGEPFDVALTFAVNDAGKPFDPADDELI